MRHAVRAAIRRRTLVRNVAEWFSRGRAALGLVCVAATGDVGTQVRSILRELPLQRPGAAPGFEVQGGS